MMEEILIINGPNLNLLGKREPEIYGKTTFLEYFNGLKQKYASHCHLSYFQSNHEGALIDKLHEQGFHGTKIILNAGAYTHTSIAIADAIASITSPVVEVHISNIHAREAFRHKSYTAASAKGSVVGLGLQGYELALLSYLDSESS